MIPLRIEKLKFLVEEMQLAFHLTIHVTDPFAARTLARHILIRAENFIDHARSLRRPLNSAGPDTRDVQKTKEAYASAVEEYFKVSRHRLSAHVQDLDFGRRIDLWNEIEIIKIGFFVDGALEIYRSLGRLGLPGYGIYTPPPDLTDPAVIEILRQFQRAIDSHNGIEMGTDPLAVTRNNTVAALNMTPVHVRAGQLVLIRRWITIQDDLLKMLLDYPRIARLLKARIITDLVSFCDCLVTRPVLPGSLQAMDGLDKLITASGQSSAPIDKFVAASNFQDALRAARDIRDTLGAHLEIDDAHTTISILANLDAYDFQQGLSFYERVSAAFIKTCHSILFLRMYAADGQRLYGVSASSAPAVPFAGGNITSPPVPPGPPPINDEQAYYKNLTCWLDGDDAQKGDARQFFWPAFAGSQVIETIAETERFSVGQHMASHEFRKAHQFLFLMLSSELSDSDFKGILDLILSCRNGWPYPLAEVLVRYGQNASVYRQWLICYVLGEIGSAPHASVRKFLKVQAHSQSWPIRLQAALARYKTFVKAEGLFRVNHRGQIREDYGAFTASLIAPMPEAERLICLFGFASILSSPGIGSLSQPFQSDYIALQARIETLCLPFLKDDDKKTKATTLKRLIQTNDYVGVCVLIAIDLTGGTQHPLHAAFIDSCCNRTIATAGHDQALRHLAMCFLMKKEHRIAFEIAEGLASRNPDWLDIQILAAQILGETPGAEEEAAQKIVSIRRLYKLTADNEAHLAATEAEIIKRKASG